MFSVHQPWDPLRECIVGRSYSPEFYKFITNERVRTVMERIARETEEDFQKLIALLNQFNVKVHRPVVSDEYTDYIVDGKIATPPMTPCDFSVMIGDQFYHSWTSEVTVYNRIRAEHWPVVSTISDLADLPDPIKQELARSVDSQLIPHRAYQHITDYITSNGNTVIENTELTLNRAQCARIGKDLFFGTVDRLTAVDREQETQQTIRLFPDYRTHIIDTIGHSDGTYCPVVPGLIVSLLGPITYEKTYPGWEVISLPGQSWNRIKPFMDLKQKNNGKWWVPGEELNDDFTNFVEGWLGHWVGYVEETVFDVNMLVIDKHNVVCNNYNKAVFDAFDARGITAHVINFRHRYFWDGGWHCVTSDLDRTGSQQDYFPGRK